MRVALNVRSGLLPAAWVVLLSACAPFAWVADYDKDVEDRIVATYEKTSRFFDAVADKPPPARDYATFAPRYAEIATDLRVLLLKQRARANNSEGEKQAQLLIDAWLRLRDRHKRFGEDDKRKTNQFPDSLIELDREQFDALFAAAIKAERFKK